MLLPQPLTIEPEKVDVPPVVPEVFSRDYAPRRLYLTRKDLLKYGHTAGCHACELQLAGIPSTGHAHTEACRDRLEAAIRC